MVVCINCGENNPWGIICQACQTPLVKPCQECGYQVKLTAHFCHRCGIALTTKAQKITRPAPPIMITERTYHRDYRDNEVGDKVLSALETAKGAPLDGTYCALCGKYNKIYEDTFRCKLCWESFICIKHKVGDDFICEICFNSFKEKPENDEKTDQNHLTLYQDDPWEEMVFIPGGIFLMGDDKREVYVPPYWIDKYPVTNARYQKFNPSHIFPPERAHYPMVTLSWFAAKEYALWAGKRLPTEAEWEKAARGVDGRIWPWGDEFDPAKCNTKESAILGYTPVDKYEAGKSPYGCYDMAGNVLEWTDSWYDSENNFKVLKGGSWENYDFIARCAHRMGYDLLTRMSLIIGFRCAKSA